jgi:hypothetical protein
MQYVMNLGEGSRPNDVAMTSEAAFQRMAVSVRKTMIETVASLKDFKHQCQCFRLLEDRYRAIFPMTKR